MVLAIAIAIIVGGLIGAWQGTGFYLKIPAFINPGRYVDLPRLDFVMVRGESMTVPQKGRNIMVYPDFFNYEGFHMTTIVVGILASILLIIADIRTRRNQLKYGV